MKFNQTPLLSEERLPDWRATFLISVFMLCFASLLGRAAYLQFVNKNFLQHMGEARFYRNVTLPAGRGRILDRNGDPLAVSVPVKSIYASMAPSNPISLTPAQERQLAGLLEVDYRDLNRRLNSGKEFVYLKRQISPEQAEQVAALKILGIGQLTEFRRYYPSADMTAHLLGFTGSDDNGLAGIELAYNKQLRGQEGQRQVIQDRRGQVVEDVKNIRPPASGQDIVLAMDSKLQYLAHSRLRACILEHRAKGGAVVILDVKTGEVLAMTNFPTFNPNNREQLRGENLRNQAITDIFELGSTMKPFTVALGLESGKFRPDTLIATGDGHMTIGKATIHDSHPGGTMTVSQVIQKSSNVGTSKIALSMPAEQMWLNFGALGFGQQLKLGFPAEAAGEVRNWHNWRPIEQATMSFGHGISVSLMQLAHAYEVFARDGDILPVSLLKTDTPPQGKQVFSARTARDVRAMLELVTQQGGTAPKAAVSGYRVAGKTGTAHKLEQGRYAPNRYIASFVGFAPASEPRLIVAVMIDEPSNGQYYGGEVAAPVFADIMASSLRVLGVPTDAPLRSMQYAPKGDEVRESM